MASPLRSVELHAAGDVLPCSVLALRPHSLYGTQPSLCIVGVEGVGAPLAEVLAYAQQLMERCDAVLHLRALVIQWQDVMLQRTGGIGDVLPQTRVNGFEIGAYSWVEQIGS